jgi:protein NDRG1
MINLLYFCGMSSFVKDTLLQRYFSQEVRTAAGVGPDVITNHRRYLDDMQSRNVMRYMQAIHWRIDLSESLKKLKCRTLIIVGEHSPFHDEALYLSKQMIRRYNALIEVKHNPFMNYIFCAGEQLQILQITFHVLVGY